MSITRAEIESFHRFALDRLAAPSAPRTMEECFRRWQAEGSAPATPPKLPPHLEDLLDVEPFPSGQSLKDRLEAKGLLGCLAGGPTDLSENPVHMEGFGRSAARPPGEPAAGEPAATP